MPGIGKVRETAPAVTTIWSYSCWYGSPTIGVIVATLFAWLMPVTFAGDDGRPLEVTTQRDDGVTRLDRAGRDLGEERLVGHVGQRVDDRDVGLALAQVLLELPGGVEACVAATDDEDLGHGVGHGGVLLLSQRLGARDANRMRRTAAVTPSATSIPLAVTSISGRVPYSEGVRRGQQRRRRPRQASAGGSGATSTGSADGRRQRIALRAPVQADPFAEAAHRVGVDGRRRRAETAAAASTSP